MDLLRQLFARYQEEAGEGGEGGGGSLLDSVGDGEDGGDSGSPDGGDANSGQAGERPEYIPEKFWNAETGEARLEDAFKSYAHMEQKLSGKNMAPESYELTAPEGFEGELLPADDPFVAGFMEVAKETGLDQETFDRLHHWYINNEMESMQANMDRELQAFDPDESKRAARLKNIADWAGANLDADAFEALKMVTSTAAGATLIESMIAKTRPARLPDDNTTTHTTVTADELRSMRFKKDDNGNQLYRTDKAYRAKVDQAYKDFYGDEPHQEMVG